MNQQTVLHLCVSSGIGGIETLLREIAARSVCRHIFCFSEDAGPAAGALRKMGCRVETLGVSGARAYRDFPAKVREICGEERPDVIVTHHEAPFLWLTARKMKKEYHIPYDIYLHSAIESVLYSGKNLGEMKAAVFAACAADARHLICISRFVQHSAERRFPRLRDKTVLIYNGIDTERFLRRTGEAAGTGKRRRIAPDAAHPAILMYAGRLIPEKGVSTLLDAFRIAEEKFPHMELRIVGDGPERGNLTRQASALGIAEKVRFAGFRSDVEDCLAAADIFVHPAIWNEGFGIAVAEAMCAGNIVVAEARGALPELISDGREGFLVREGGAGPLAEGILRAIRVLGTAEEAEMRANAVRKAQKFSTDAMVRKLDRLWSGLPLRVGVFGMSEFSGGTENYLMTLWRGLDKTKVQFDFLLNHGAGRLPWEDEILSGGGRIFREYYALSERNLPGYLGADEILARHPDWAGVYLNLQHIHTACRLLTAAARKGLRYRILHAHNAGYDHVPTRKERLYESYFYAAAPRAVTHCLACSDEAGKWLFRGRPFAVIPNAVDFARFQADARQRREMREKLGIAPTSVVVGFCARLEEQKNPLFALEVFRVFQTRVPGSRFLVVGGGSLMEEMRRRVSEEHLADDVIFTGGVNDAAPYYAAMDCFLMPSRYEGFGISAVEAQAAGLHCCVTEGAVPRDVDLTGRVTFVPADAGAAAWADALIRGGFDRADTLPALAKSDYTVEKMEARFMRIFEKKNFKNDETNDQCDNSRL